MATRRTKASSQPEPTAEAAADAREVVSPLDQEPYLTMFRQTRESIRRAFEELGIGEPEISLEELRELTREAFGDESFSDWIIKDRASQP